MSTMSQIWVKKAVMCQCYVGVQTHWKVVVWGLLYQLTARHRTGAYQQTQQIPGDALTMGMCLCAGSLPANTPLYSDASCTQQVGTATGNGQPIINPTNKGAFTPVGSPVRPCPVCEPFAHQPRPTALLA